MTYLADWLRHLPRNEISQQIIKRIQDFDKWCHQQARGTDADDDILTILTVSFYEDLTNTSSGRFVLSKLLKKQDVISNKEYYQHWIGKENYQKLLDEY